MLQQGILYLFYLIICFILAGWLLQWVKHCYTWRPCVYNDQFSEDCLSFGRKGRVGSGMYTQLNFKNICNEYNFLFKIDQHLHI